MTPDAISSSTQPAKGPLREKVQQWVSQAFIGEMLKQVRNSPFKSELFSGGKAGDTYQQLYDQHIIDQVAPAIGGQLIDSMVRHLGGEQVIPKSAPSAARTSPSRSVETELQKRYQFSAPLSQGESETRHDALDHPA